MSRRRPLAAVDRRIACCIVVLAATAMVGSAPAMASETLGPLRLPQDDPPASLAQLEPLGDSVVALSHDGVLAAVAHPDPERSRFGLVRISSTDWEAPREIAVRGGVQALRFGAEGRTLFAIVKRQGKKRVLDTHLLVVDLAAALEATRAVTLPASASALDLWPGGSAVLVACHDEIRTVRLPEARSGPLFWVKGENRSVASLPGGDLILVGQDQEILVIDLTQPHGREAMPVRERIAIPSPVTALAAAPDGTEALALLEDGRAFRVRLEPLRLEEQGRARHVAWLGEPRTPPPATPIDPPVPEPESPAVPPTVEPAVTGTPVTEAEAQADTGAIPPASEPASRSEPPIEPTPRQPLLPEAPPATQPKASTVRPPDPTPRPTPKEAESEKAVTAPVPPAPEVRRREVDSSYGEIEGKVTGSAASQVVAVVLLGPDNILREARRIAPRADGTWAVRDLEPGRYRVVLDGGGQRVIVSEPRFLILSVEAGVRVEAPQIEALRTVP